MRFVNLTSNLKNYDKISSGGKPVHAIIDELLQRVWLGNLIMWASRYLTWSAHIVGLFSKANKHFPKQIRVDWYCILNV